MDEELFGTLTVRLGFTKHVDGKRYYTGQASLVRFHGRLGETKEAYREWCNHNHDLINHVSATFEVKMAVHQDW